MTSTLKTTIDVNTSALDSDNLANKADLLEPIADIEDELETARQRVSVSAADTHYKHLNDAIGVAGSISKAITNPAADEVLTLSLVAKLESLVAALTVAGKVPAAGMDSTGANSGYVATANGSGAVSWAAAGGGGAQPVDITVTAGETLAERDIVYLNTSDNKFYKVDVDSDPVKLSAIRGVVNQTGGIANAATGTIRMAGEVTGFTGLTAWADVYAGATAGAYTQTKPTITAGGAQVGVVRIGVAISTSAVLVNTMPFANPCQFMKRASLADDGTLTLKHYSDSLARLRRYRAFLSGSAAGVSHTTYASSNQDSRAILRGTSGAGGSTSHSSSASTAAIGNAGGNPSWTAQGFQITAGVLSQFTYDLGANVGSPSGTITWEIQTDNAGVPSGTVLATGVHASPTASATNTVNITDGILLAAATTYWLVLKPTTPQSSGVFWQWNISSSSGYANGTRALSTNSGSSWTASPTTDCSFSVTTSAAVVKDKLAQSFQVSGSQTVDLLKLWLKKYGSPVGTMTLRIETDTAGAPSGTLADVNATVTVAESGLTTSYGWISFDFATNFTLSGSTTYWMVLSTDRAASVTNYVEWGADGSSPGYASGSMSYNASSAWSAESKDAVFDVVGPATTFDTPVSVCSWNADSAEVEITAGDGATSPGNLDTQTTLKNRKNATADITLVVELD